MARTRWYYAPCPLGLEPVLAAEVLTAGGLDSRVERGGVAFRGTAATGYALTLWTRVASRVYEELERGKIATADDVYTVARRVQWKKYLRPGQTFAISATTRSPLFNQPHYAALKVKDAIADQLREQTGSRPDVDTDDPDLPLRVVVRDGRLTVSRDLAGTSLHKRGYRAAAQHKSPLNEALAAGLLQLTSWDRASPLCDPMCGSGTFLIEAAFIAGDRAPGLFRSFAFERWTDRDRAAWDTLKSEATARWAAGRSNIPPLLGNDRHSGAIALCRKAIGRAQLDGLITLVEGEVRDLVPDPTPAVVVCNPPYGERLDPSDLQDTWYALGQFLKQRCPGATAWVLAGNPELTRHLQMRSSKKTPVFNGTIECRWLEYSVRG